MSKTDILGKLKRNCEARDLIFADAIYSDEIDNAIEAVNERRGFTPTNNKPYEEKYSNLIYKLALYALTKIGVEGQTSHKENGIYRTYQSASDYPSDLMNEITPLVKS